MNQHLQLASDELAIRKLLDEVITAFNAGDVDQLLALHTDDIILMEPNMPAIKGKEQVRSMFTAFQQKKTPMKLDFELLEFEVSQHLAFVRGSVSKRVFQDGVETAPEEGKFICLLKKQQSGAWLRSHVILNSDQP